MPAVMTRDQSKPRPPNLTVEEDDESSSCSHSEEGEVADAPDSEQNQGKDSGVDCGTDAKFEPPDEETSARILQTVEYYLSDSNILKDPFLLKHVRRNKDGYVSLKLISSFRKVRSLCRNWKTVAYSVQKSDKLALNDDGTKIRRLKPLPDYDETFLSRTVVAHGFAEDEKFSVETVSEIFSKCGDIALVRVLRPGNSIPSEVRRFLPKDPDIQSKICALVEFEEHAGAKKALEIDNFKENCRPGLHVLPLAGTNEKDKQHKQPKSQQTPTKADSTPKDSPKKKKRNKKNQNAQDPKISNSADDQGPRARRSSSGSLGYWSSGSMSSSGYLSSSPGSAYESRFPRRHSHQGVNTSYLEAITPAFASLSNRNYHGSKERMNRERESEKYHRVQVPPGSQSPWRMRREQMMSSHGFLPSALNANSIHLRHPVQTIRMPRGPDDTKGFQQRGRLPSTAE